MGTEGEPPEDYGLCSREYKSIFGRQTGECSEQINLKGERHWDIGGMNGRGG